MFEAPGGVAALAVRRAEKFAFCELCARSGGDI